MELTGEGLVSVVVPVYNQEPYLDRCLASLRNQTYSRLEIILVDDGSTDASGRMCDGYAREDPRFRVIHKANEGAGAARNTGQETAKGQWLLFVDADDYFNLDMIRLMHEAAVSAPDIDLVMAGAERTTSREESVAPPAAADLPPARLLSREAMMEGLTARENTLFAVDWNKLYRREVIDGIRHRSFDRDEDFDFNLRVFRRVRKGVFLDKTLYWWFQNPDSATHAPDTLARHYNCRFRILADYLRDVPDDGPVLRRLFRDLAFYSGWQYRRRSDSMDKEMRAFVKDLRKRHTGAYLQRKGIPLPEKTACLLMSGCSFLSHALMRLTKNV